MNMKTLIMTFSLLITLSFCNTVHSQSCIDSSLINLNMICLEIYEPVCGCDQVTYSNDCEATYYFGVTSYTFGECNTSGIEQTENNEKLCVYPSPSNDGIFSINYMGLVSRVEMVDVFGRIFKVPYNAAKREIDASSLNAGKYFLKIESKKHLFIQQVFIIK